MRFSLQDCEKIIEIHGASNKSEDREYTHELKQEILDLFNICFDMYTIAECDSSYLTEQQYKALHKKTSDKTDALIKQLREPETLRHLLTRISLGLLGEENLIKLDGARIQHLYTHLSEAFNDVLKSLIRLQVVLGYCYKDNIDYSFVEKSSKSKKSETTLIINLSRVLNFYLGSGGYTHDPINGNYKGWKIECLTYLADRTGVNIQSSQIYNCLSNYAPINSK